MISNCSGLTEIVPAVWIEDRADGLIPNLLYEEMWLRGLTGFQTSRPAGSLSRPPNSDMQRHTPAEWRVPPVERDFGGSGSLRGGERELRGRNGCGQKSEVGLLLAMAEQKAQQ